MAAPRPSSIRSLALCLCGLAWLSACADPVFIPAKPMPDASVDAAPSDGQRSEPGDAGSEPQVPAPGCVGPLCDDASVLPAPDVDAGTDAAVVEPSPDAGLDAVRMKWVGRYAARSTLFTFDDPIKSSAKLLSIITIKPDDAGGLMMEQEMCLYEGAWSFLFTGVLRYEFKNTRGSAKLTYDKDGFESEIMTLRVGYGPTPAGCRAGATMMSSPEQTWISNGTCDCPRSDTTPTSLRDCRVTDQESDKQPGATFQASIDAAPILYHAAQEERLQLLKGYRQNDRLYANLYFEDTTRILDCVVNGTVTAAASCPNGTPKNCPSKYNTVELASDFKLGCADLALREQSLFVSPMPPFPQSCPAEVSGGAARVLSAQP